MSLSLALFLYVLIGGVAGIIGGLLGLGGGVVTVPCLLIVFRSLDFPSDRIMLMAIATSLAAMIFNTLGATWAHNRRGSVVWNVVIKMLPGFLLGSILGALIATVLSSRTLEIFFAVFLCVLGIYFIFKKTKVHSEYTLPSAPVLSLFSTVIGAISNVLGIGGGAMTVPLFMTFKFNEKKAIGTSAATTLILTTIGAISYLFLGLNHGSSDETVGFLNLPAFIVIGIVSFASAPLGVKLTHILPVKMVRQIFAIVMILTGISLFLGL